MALQALPLAATRLTDWAESVRLADRELDQDLELEPAVTPAALPLVVEGASVRQTGSEMPPTALLVAGTQVPVSALLVALEWAQAQVRALPVLVFPTQASAPALARRQVPQAHQAPAFLVRRAAPAPRPGRATFTRRTTLLPVSAAALLPATR